ncbi:unnamed protein product [Ambrosiozyma monospora]|uniref:Unnamed protein product n=1 Tax=Ambrosiozyma monospora TaxID=43982 RepID=A0ACB5SR64_AMBMO|nr:unnamed protein product [Ambrosiozyma monospora]
MNHTAYIEKCIECSKRVNSSSSPQRSSHGNGSKNSSRQLVINNQDLVLEDFLPSFEMHNYMFNRSFRDTECIGDEHPPTYEEQFLQQADTADASIPADIDYISPEISSARYVDPTVNPDMLVLNNLDSMQDLNLPIKLTIVLTKKPISENIPSEMETPLKLYKPGDIVTGYMYSYDKKQ